MPEFFVPRGRYTSERDFSPSSCHTEAATGGTLSQKRHAASTAKGRKERYGVIDRGTRSVRNVLAFGLGSNLGDRQGNLRKAIAGLEEVCGPLNVAPFYSTGPISPIAQPEYLNTVAIAPCSTPQPKALDAARELLERIKRLEWEVGRRPGARFGPRILDIDLLFFGDLVHQDPEPSSLEDQESYSRWLVLPHPRMHQRRFVLAPLNDLAPHLELPPDGVPVHELLAQLGEEQTVTRFH